MKKTKIFLISILILGLLPLIGFAQFDFNLDDFLFNDLDIGSSFIINSFDLIWSTNTYTPYGYQGRVLPSLGSEVIVEAIVNASGGNPNGLKHSWFLEDVFQTSKSGYGKDTFSFYVRQRPGAYHTVRLQIFNEDRSVFVEKSIKIPIVEPELVIEPSTILPGREFSFIARPYFFSIKKLTDLEFEWNFPGQEPIISSAYDASVLDLIISEKEGEKIIEKELWVSVKNKKASNQKAYQTIKVQIY